MNECFFIGKVVSEVKYDFLYGSKNHISIARFDILVKSKNIIKVVGLDEMADFMYYRIKVNDNVFVYGGINSNYIVNSRKIKIL